MVRVEMQCKRRHGATSSSLTYCDWQSRAVSESVAALDSSQDFLLVLHWQDWPDTLTGEGVLSGVGGDYNWFQMLMSSLQIFWRLLPSVAVQF